MPRHLRAESDLDLRVLEAIELAGRPPDIRFEPVTDSEGMELIERLRSRA